MSTWNVEAMTGYTPQTTFWEDFSIAEEFGEKPVRSTFRSAFNEWKGNYIYLTELVMVLNHKIWELYETNESLARVYNELWMKADEYGCEHLEGDELSYFYRTLD